MLSVRPNMPRRVPGPVNQNKTWQETIGNIPGVIEFNKDTLPYLSAVLSRFTSNDPYVLCPAYHAFTGRHGLWGYAKGKSFLLFARHPNKPKTILFYPQFGNAFPNLALELLKNLKLPGFDFMFARYPTEYADFMAASMNKANTPFNFEAIREAVLDWTYPVHTLSTRSVVEATGKNFKSFRYDLHRVNQKEITTSPIHTEEDIKELASVIDVWTSAKLDLDDPQDTLYSYQYLLKLIQQDCLNLSGLKFYKNNQLVAFEVWSLPENNNKTANNLAGLNINAIEDLQGFSSYQYYTVCKTLLEQGVDYLCIGGSETAGLDHFKRKMSPVNSLPLQSIAVRKMQRTKIKQAS